jgi:uncharacterized protein (TIGR03067 family)
MNGIAWLLVTGIAVLPTADEPRDVRIKMIGTWNAVEVIFNGHSEKLDSGKALIFTIAADKITINDNGKAEECSYTIDARKAPVAIDITTHKKQIVKAIVETEGNKLRVCFAMPGEKSVRPADFSAKEGSGVVCIVFEKQKK